MAKILLVDDDEYFRDRLTWGLSRRGHQVVAVGDRAGAMAALAGEAPGLAVVDLRIPGSSGLKLVREALAARPLLKIVVLTDYGGIATATKAIRLGAISYLPKPTDAVEILAAFALPTSADQPGDEGNEDTGASSLARVEWQHINRVLTDCAGNISEAAKRLRLHRRTLQRKLNKFPPPDLV